MGGRGCGECFNLHTSSGRRALRCVRPPPPSNLLSAFFHPVLCALLCPGRKGANRLGEVKPAVAAPSDNRGLAGRRGVWHCTRAPNCTDKIPCHLRLAVVAHSNGDPGDGPGDLLGMATT